ncbi:MAG: hypothetical protein JWM30_1110 [Burkholderia sp.]|nr:hypothetical protein [Burkholderia sp.]
MTKDPADLLRNIQNMKILQSFDIFLMKTL